MKALRDLQKVQAEKERIEDKHRKILEKRLKEIALIIGNLDLASTEDSVLIGSLLFMKEKASLKDPLIDEWKKNGEKYFKKRRSKPLSSS